jgi:quercetin dioxygenase-like cupin family protein
MMTPNIEKDLQKEGYSLHSWSNGPDFWYPVHAHPYHKIIVVMKGSITFYLPNEKREVAMMTGERLELPPHTEHSAQVGPEGVECLEGQKT